MDGTQKRVRLVIRSEAGEIRREGTAVEKNGARYLIYSHEGVQRTVKVTDGRVLLCGGGTRMELEEGVSRPGVLATPYGELPLETAATRVIADKDMLTLEYTLSVAGGSEQHRVTIKTEEITNDG